MLNEFKWHQAPEPNGAFCIHGILLRRIGTSLAKCSGFCVVFEFLVERSVFAFRRGTCSAEKKKLFVSVGRNFIRVIPQLTTPVMIWFYLRKRKCLGSGCKT